MRMTPLVSGEQSRHSPPATVCCSLFAVRNVGIGNSGARVMRSCTTAENPSRRTQVQQVIAVSTPCTCTRYIHALTASAVADPIPWRSNIANRRKPGCGRRGTLGLRAEVQPTATSRHNAQRCDYYAYNAKSSTGENQVRIRVLQAWTTVGILLVVLLHNKEHTT